MSVNKKKRGLVLAVISLSLVLVLLSACSRIPGRNNSYLDWENNIYYQGVQGVEMAFVPGVPPYKMFYYGDQYDNTFDVQVEMANIGSSWARGALFISGYDPTMIQFQGVNPIRSTGRACQIDIGNIGFGQFGGTLRCDNYFVGASSDLSIIDIGVNNLGGRFEMGQLIGGVDINYERLGDQNQWSFGFDNPGIDIEYANHGRLLISMFSALDFTRNFGTEYLLEGDTYEYPNGEVNYINFDGTIVTWPAGLDYTYQSFLITNCFLYATYAAPVVCIDPSPYSEDRKVCIPRTYTGTAGQGAPVAVTYIYQENSPRQATFEIHIKNVGGGQVYDPGMLEMCSPYFPARVTNENLNIVYIGDVRVSGDLQRLRCTPNNYVRLNPQTGEGVVTCMYEIPFSGMRSAYNTPIVVELWYGYSKTMEKKVLIKRAI